MELPAKTEEYSPDAVTASKGVISSLLLAVRMLSLYPEDHSLYKSAVASLQDHLETFLSKHEELIFHVEKSRLLFAGEVVHEGEAKDGDLAFALFRDGILDLVFQRGLDSGEIGAFIKILDRYKSLPAEAEGDIVTALWEAELPHLRWEASDIMMEADSEGKFSTSEKGGEGLAQLSPRKEGDAFAPMEMQGGEEGPLEATLVFKDLPRIDLASLLLTDGELESLNEMARREEERDAIQEILNIMVDLLGARGDEQLCDVVFEYLEEELQSTLGKKDFDVSLRILTGLHRIRELCKESKPLALARTKEVFTRASGPDFLGSLQEVLPTLSAVETEKVKEVLLLLTSRAIGSLGPMMLETRSVSVRTMLSDVIVSLAAQDLNPFVQVLNSAEEDLLRLMVPLLGRLDDERSAKVLVKMAHHQSEGIRVEALRAIMGRDLWDPEKIKLLLDDESDLIRDLSIRYFGSRRSESAEGVLLSYLQDRRFRSKHSQDLSAYLRTLGRCGTSRSVPFLQGVLLRGGWISRFRGSTLRKGAAIALTELGTEAAGQTLEVASRSRYPGIRSAAQAVMKEQSGLGEKR